MDFTVKTPIDEVEVYEHRKSPLTVRFTGNIMETSDNQVAKKEFLTYHQMSLRGAISIVLFISIALTFIWFKFGHISNPWLVIYPREPKSLIAIFTSNLFHGNKEHLISNLIVFIPIGIWALKQEGWRALSGIFYGILFSGITIWIFGQKGCLTLGFSGAVFALFGVLLISSIRSINIIILLALFACLQLLGDSFFNGIRPTDYSIANHISWLGHLGGFIGGIWSQLNDSSIALEILLKNEDITPEEYNLIAGRICTIPENNNEENVASADEDKNLEQEKEDTQLDN